MLVDSTPYASIDAHQRNASRDGIGYKHMITNAATAKRPTAINSHERFSVCQYLMLQKPAATARATGARNTIAVSSGRPGTPSHSLTLTFANRPFVGVPAFSRCLLDPPPKGGTPTDCVFAALPLLRPGRQTHDTS